MNSFSAKSDFERNGSDSRADTAQTKSHSVVLKDRKHLEITGVTDVIRFDLLSAELETVRGTLYIDGEDLHMEAYDTERGIVVLNGEMRTLDYADGCAEKTEKKHFFFRKQ
jgi:sporulation protein YabP